MNYLYLEERLKAIEKEVFPYNFCKHEWLEGVMVQHSSLHHGGGFAGKKCRLLCGAFAYNTNKDLILARDSMGRLVEVKPDQDPDLDPKSDQYL